MSALRNNTARSRFEMEEEGYIAYAEYRLDGDRLFIDYVFAPPPLRGKGSAGRLMTAIGQEAQAQGWRITPLCSYAAGWLRRSKEFGSLVESNFP